MAFDIQLHQTVGLAGRLGYGTADAHIDHACPRPAPHGGAPGTHDVQPSLRGSQADPANQYLPADVGCD